MVKKIFSAMLFAATVVVTPLSAESIVILHTNDTHSNIDPDKNGVGGILQRKARAPSTDERTGSDMRLMS